MDTSGQRGFDDHRRRRRCDWCLAIRRRRQRNRQAADRRNLLEFNRALWEEEFKTYRDISAAVGDLVAAVEMGDAEAREQVSDVIRFLNLPRGPHPVVFSAPPGTLALPEQDPIDGNTFIAPMARRLVLAAQAAEAPIDTLDLAELVRALTHDEEKFGERPGVTWFDGSFETGSILVPGGDARASMDRRRGTASAAQPCCQEGVSGLAPDADTITWVVEGEVAFHSDGEDFVTGGEPLEARFEADDVTVWEITHNSLDIDVDLHDGRWFSLALSVPGSAFVPGFFAQAQRHGFAEAGRPGMAVSIEGSACNEVAGTFELTAVGNDKSGKLRTLDVELRQICDGGPGALVGSARLRFMAARKVEDASDGSVRVGS